VKRKWQTYVALAALALAACSADPKKKLAADRPAPDEIKLALEQLLANHPNLSTPEFAASLSAAPQVQPNGDVRIGYFNCDMHLLMFDATLLVPNYPITEIEGRFERDTRQNWRAVLLYSQKRNVVGDPDRRLDWYHTQLESWSREGKQ